MIIGTIVSSVANLRDRFHVKVIGYIPTGYAPFILSGEAMHRFSTRNFSMPTPTLPDVSLFGYVLGDALAIAIVSLVVTVSMGKLFAKKHNYEIDVRQVNFQCKADECALM